MTQALLSSKTSADEPRPSTTTGQLSSGALGTADIVFMVVAAAAPMAVVVA
jgi:hypothetical protein